MFSCTTVNQYFKDLKSLHEIAVILLPVIINIFCWGSSITKKNAQKSQVHIYRYLITQYYSWLFIFCSRITQNFIIMDLSWNWGECFFKLVSKLFYSQHKYTQQDGDNSSIHTLLLNIRHLFTFICTVSFNSNLLNPPPPPTSYFSNINEFIISNQRLGRWPQSASIIVHITLVIKK